MRMCAGQANDQPLRAAVGNLALLTKMLRSQVRMNDRQVFHPHQPHILRTKYLARPGKRQKLKERRCVLTINQSAPKEHVRLPRDREEAAKRAQRNHKGRARKRQTRVGLRELIERTARENGKKSTTSGTVHGGSKPICRVPLTARGNDVADQDSLGSISWSLSQDQS